MEIENPQLCFARADRLYPQAPGSSSLDWEVGSILSFTQKAFEFICEGTRVDRLREVAIETRIQHVLPVTLHRISGNS
jgi:hypothetical protein